MDELIRINQAQQAVFIAEQQLVDAVTAARQAGRSWAEIGNTLNISRQAAFKRFGAVTNPFTGETMTPRPTVNLISQAEEFLTSIATGDESHAMALMHPKVRKDLPWSTLTEVWENVLTEVGTFQGFSNSVVTSIKGDRNEPTLRGVLTTKLLGTAVVVTTLQHEAGELMARVAIDRGNQVVGVLILPLEATDYRF